MGINNSMYVCRVLESGFRRRLAKQQVYLMVEKKNPYLLQRGLTQKHQKQEEKLLSER